MSLFHSVWTVLMFALFVGIVVWAWSRDWNSSMAVGGAATDRSSSLMRNVSRRDQPRKTV